MISNCSFGRSWEKLFFSLLIFLLSSPLSYNEIKDLNYYSRLNNTDIPIKVYTPPGYGSGSKRYPVVYYLHGGGGSPQRQWERIGRTLNAAMNSEITDPVIYVFVNGLGNTEFVNTVDGKYIERSIVEEPCYENHPVNHKPENGYFSSWNVRTVAYWSVFAGVAGFTYRGIGVWQMDITGKPPHRATHFTQTWDKALNREGANQMKYLRALIELRPFLIRVPDQGNTLLISEPGKGEDHIQVTHGSDCTWAMFYSTSGKPFTVNLANIRGPQVIA